MILNFLNKKELKVTLFFRLIMFLNNAFFLRNKLDLVGKFLYYFI